MLSLSTSRSQQHHYIPRLLLEQFCDQQGLLWIANQENTNPFRRRPTDIFHVRNLYSDHGPERAHSVQLPPRDYEKMLGELERRAAPVILHAIERVRTNQWPFRSQEDETLFKRFLLSMARRTPDSQMRMLASEEGKMLFHAKATSLSNQGVFGRLEPDAAESMRTDEIKRLNKGRAAYAGVAAGDSQFACEEERRFCEESGLSFLRKCVHGESFLIGSHGIGILNLPDGSQFGFLPLAPDLCVASTNSTHETSIRKLNNQSESLVKAMNTSSAVLSRTVAGNSKSLVASHAEMIGSRRTW